MRLEGLLRDADDDLLAIAKLLVIFNMCECTVRNMSDFIVVAEAGED